MHVQILNSNKRSITTLFICICLLLAIFSTASCKFGFGEAAYRPNGVTQRATSLTNITLPSSVLNSSIYQSHKYNFMILTDLHYGSATDVPEQQILNWIDKFDESSETISQKPLFCIILGDVADSGNREQFAAFNTFQNKLEEKGIPVYCIVGNHDLLNSGWQYWKTSCNPGTSFYKIATSTVSWYFTDTGSGTMGDKQLAALENAFAEDNNRKLVFSHYPLYGGGNGIPMFSIGNEKERARLINLYAKNNVKYVFEGHWHMGCSNNFGSFQELVATTLKNGKWYLVSIDETTAANENPVAAVTTINSRSF